MKRAFVVGWPISHSISPMLHGYWLRKYDVEGSYDPISVPPDRFAPFLQDLAAAGYVGGNVTIPHKEAAFSLCRSVDENAAAVGAVNTVWMENAEICGANTDVLGFLANLDEKAPGWDRAERALVLGAGGASRAVLHALLNRKFLRVELANRTRARAESLAAMAPDTIGAIGWEDLGEAASRSGLIVNTTSLGMTGQAPLHFDPSAAPAGTVVVDLVYNPLRTRLLKAAEAAGLVAVDGLGMLIHQAVPGFEKWFGVRPETDHELRRYLVEKLAMASP